MIKQRKIYYRTNIPKSVDFDQTNGCNHGSFGSTCHLSFSIPRQLAHKRCNTQQTYIIHCLQTVQNVGVIPNLKKSDLKPAQQFTFIGMEFLTQQNIFRVPLDCIKSLTLTQILAQIFLSLLGELSAASDLVVLGRLHFRRLQVCLLSVWRPHILPLYHQVPITSMI